LELGIVDVGVGVLEGVRNRTFVRGVTGVLAARDRLETVALEGGEADPGGTRALGTCG
jgi:hypothetical protein